jgi:ATP-dependent RNA helicase RhlE
VAIHGDKSQSRRQAVMREFNSQRPPVLVATDLAARGLDFTDVSHVINYDMPDAPETYVHRIGRTARAGNSGHAVTFCGHDERQRLRMIEKLTGQVVTVETVHGERPVGPASGNHAPPSPTMPNDSNTALADSNGGQPSQPRPKHRARRGARPPQGGAPGGPGGSKRRKFSKPGGGQKKRRPPATSSGN